MLVPEDRELCFLTLGRIPWTGIGQSQGLYLHRTAQHRKTSTILTEDVTEIVSFKIFPGCFGHRPVKFTIE
jgi:hypothetical protein